MREQLPFRLFKYSFVNGKNIIKEIIIKDLKSDIRLNTHNPCYTSIIVSPKGDVILCDSHYNFYNYVKKKSQKLYGEGESVYDMYINLWSNKYVTADISYNSSRQIENIFYSSYKMFKTQYNILEFLAIYLECNLIEVNHKKLHQLTNSFKNNIKANYVVNDSYMTYKYIPPWTSYE